MSEQKLKVTLRVQTGIKKRKGGVFSATTARKEKNWSETAAADGAEEGRCATSRLPLSSPLPEA
uniref:Uncharacterized protein n=1 Tax=Leersia perrieri TaxID=77586 RepID=A0A0D9XZV7_9ORYZ